MLRRRLSYTASVGMMLATAIAAAQAPTQSQTEPAQPIPPVTFKVEINYVEVDARVVDAQGTFVRNLKKEDFQILENGKPQTISAFALVNVPVVPVEKPLFATEPIEPDVVSNARRFDGRLYVLVLDDLHTDPLRSQRVKMAARKFIEQNLGANDLAAVVVTGGRSDASQDLTSNRRLLLVAVDKFMGQKPRSATLEKIERYNLGVGTGTLQPNERLDDPFDQERLLNARRSLDAVRGVAEWLGDIHGRRKALIYIGEGIDYDITDVFSSSDGQFNFSKANVGEIMTYTRDAIAAATRSSVIIYAVDPRGLTGMADESIELGSLADARPPPDDSGTTPSGGMRTDLGLRSLYTELQISQDSLRSLAEDTGGFAALNRNDFTTSFDRIQDENSSYYVMGYYPANDKRDGKFRKIDVRVTRPGLTVRARKGYLAPRGKPASTNLKRGEVIPDETTAGLRDLIQSPIPVSGLTMDVSAVSFKGTSPNASVTVLVEARGGDLKFAEKDGKFNGDLIVSIGAFDKDGKMKAGERPKVNLGLRPETYQRVKAQGVRVVSRLDLPPGRYQLRVASREGMGRTEGSVHYDLEVPDFSKGPLSMSGVVLASTADSSPTVGADALFGGGLPGPPTALREFPANGELALFVEVYDNQPTPPHKIDITSTVQSDDGRVVFKTEEARSSDELQGSRGGYGYAARLPLKGLAPGLYVLTVEAGTRLGKAEPVRRAVQFRIR